MSAIYYHVCNTILSDVRSAGSRLPEQSPASLDTDWLSLVHETMDSDQFVAFVDTIRQSDEAILTELFERVIPGNEHVWKYAKYDPDITTR